MPQPIAEQTLTMTVVTVCLAAELGESLLHAADGRGWAVQEAHFESYISAKRRPHLGGHLYAGAGCIAVVDFDGDPQAAAETVVFLRHAFPERLVVIANSSVNTADLILLAMRAGCTEFLVTPMTQEDLEGALTRAEEKLINTRAASHTAGAVLSFLGAKGGVGSTTLALHLATFLAVNHKKKVLLIDNHAQFGHACIYLGIDGSDIHFQELVRNVSRLDSELLRGFVATHESGVDVLSSPDLGKSARLMHPDDVAGTIDFLRGEYDFVIVDCAAQLDDVNRAVLSAATHVYVVATPEISAIRDLSRYVDDLVNLEDVKEKVRVILNRYSSQFAVDLEIVERAIRLPVTFCIPNNYVELVRSANLGVPVPSDSKSGFAMDMRRWCDSLVGVKAVETPRVVEKQPAASSWESFKGSLSVLLPNMTMKRKQA